MGNKSEQIESVAGQVQLNTIKHPIPFGSIIGIGNKNRFEIIGINLEESTYRLIGEEFELSFNDVKTIYEIKMSEIRKESAMEFLNKNEDGVKAVDMLKGVAVGQVIIEDQSKSDMVKHPKPPIGITPKKHHERLVKTERFNELCGAISRYFEACLKIDIEWIKEYNELIDELKD